MTSIRFSRPERQEPPTTSFGGVTPSSGVSPLPTIEGGTIRFIGAGHFIVTVDPITQTGSDVTTLLTIPFPHELTTIAVKHVDDTGADSAVAQTTTFYHRFNNSWFNLWSIVAGTAKDTYAKFTDAFQPSGQYRIVSNTTVDHKLKIQIDLFVMERFA